MIGKIRVLPCVMRFNQDNGVIENCQARDTRLFIILLYLTITAHRFHKWQLCLSRHFHKRNIKNLSHFHKRQRLGKK
jgi:hypothetical protein